jgi:LysM repeat protein
MPGMGHNRPALRTRLTRASTIGGNDVRHLVIGKLILVSLLFGVGVQAQTLKGSAASINKQHRAALSYGYAFVDRARSVQNYIRPGQLERVSPGPHMALHDVSYPYAVPSTKAFLSRLSQQYHYTCGEKLTVTSLLRPRDRQPSNSVARSVHPTGMAVDLRIPRTAKCRDWLERTLLSLERQGAVDVTRERYPPHYHVAVFNKNPGTGLAANSGSRESYVAQGKVAQGRVAQGSVAQAYKVRRGDTLSGIATRAGVAINQLRAANGLRGNLIHAGQTLKIPATGTRGAAQEVAALSEFTHRVSRGETLWRIANRYGTSVENLRRTNRHAGDSLQVGQVLKISRG